jgi:hypothetical protein
MPVRQDGLLRPDQKVLPRKSDAVPTHHERWTPRLADALVYEVLAQPGKLGRTTHVEQVLAVELRSRCEFFTHWPARLLARRFSMLALSRR